MIWRVFTLNLLLGLAAFYPVKSQDAPVIKFESNTHDFGLIQEVDGPVEHSFTFTNVGNKPLKLTEVKASCGCTTPEWTKKEVAPGDKGMVKARYNPRNRPGSFRKSITVKSNAPKNGVVLLYINGTVKPKPSTPADDYPSKIGDLRLKYRSFNIGKVLTNESITKSFDVYNDGNGPVKFLDKKYTPEYIKIAVTPKVLSPHEKGEIKVTFDGSKVGSLGFSSDIVKLFTDEKNHGEKQFTVMATLEEYFPPMTKAELEAAPRLTFEKESHDFGPVKQGDTVKTTFSFTNTGKSTLNIRETQANCGCTVSDLATKNLAPQESGTITVSFNSSGRRGRQIKRVTVFTNDPRDPTRTITINANVKVEE